MWRDLTSWFKQKQLLLLLLLQLLQLLRRCNMSGLQQTTRTAQDTIASILTSMNPQEAANTRVDYGIAEVGEVDEVVALNAVKLEQLEDRQEVLPLNLVTTNQNQATVIQNPSALVNLHAGGGGGVKRSGQPIHTTGGVGGFVTKKVIIATINGTQRILTPVSSPQIISMKSSARALAPEALTAEALSSAENNGASPTIVIQKPLTQLGQPAMQLSSPVVTNSRPATDNKTCLWKFENGQVCGKQFTKTYNLTVHMRMHQDIRPFPCAICEQTFRQKAHLQRHEATHGIDSTANRKRRKRAIDDQQGPEGLMSSNLSGTTGSRAEELYPNKPKLIDSQMKNEAEEEGEEDIGVDPMIEPIVRKAANQKILCPVNVATNTEAEETDLQPVKFPPPSQVVSRGIEQGVQYNEEDILPDSAPFKPGYDTNDEEIAAAATAKNIVRYIQPSQTDMKKEVADVELVNADFYAAAAGQQYISDAAAIARREFSQPTDDSGQFIDTSSNQIVISHDEGELVGFMPVEEEEDTSQVVNISTTVDEQGQQVVIIENLHHHSPELQREIMNALISENNLVPMTHS